MTKICSICDQEIIYDNPHYGLYERNFKCKTDHFKLRMINERIDYIVFTDLAGEHQTFCFNHYGKIQPTDENRYEKCIKRIRKEWQTLKIFM